MGGSTFVHVIGLGDNVSDALDLHERVEVCAIGTDIVILPIDSHHHCRRRNREQVQMQFDVGHCTAFSDRCEEVANRPARLFAIDKNRTSRRPGGTP